MRVVVSNPASDLIDEGGGRVYVWPKKSRCCGAVTTLATSSEPPRRREFVRVETAEEFELYLDARQRRLPDTSDQLCVLTLAKSHSLHRV